MPRIKHGRLTPATVVVSSLGFLTILTVVSVRPARGPLGIDSAWNALMASSDTLALVEVAKVLNIFGGPVVSGLVIPAMLLLVLLVGHRYWATLFVILVCVGRGAAVSVVKVLVDRPRPEGGLVSVHSESFPSGHSASAAIIVLMLALIFSSQRWLPYFGGVYVLSMMWSRTYLHVHWFTDTIAGGLLGLLVVLAGWMVLHERVAQESQSRMRGTGNSSSSKNLENEAPSPGTTSPRSS